MEDLRQELVEVRRELVEVRAEVVGLKGGQAKLLASHAEAKRQMDRMEALLRGLQAKEGGRPADEPMITSD